MVELLFLCIGRGGLCTLEVRGETAMQSVIYIHNWFARAIFFSCRIMLHLCIVNSDKHFLWFFRSEDEKE